MLVPIREVRLSDYEGAVHNLETKDHTYLIGPVVSHNCDAVSRVLVEQKVADVFVNKVLKETEAYKLEILRSIK